MLNRIRQDLLALADPAYQTFQSKLVPHLPPEKILGVRMPALRSYARTLSGEQKQALLSALPHDLYEEDNLHALLLMEQPGQDLLEKFLPHIDNWATCDLLRPASFRGRPSWLLPKVEEWLQSPHEYTVRFALGVLLSYYLEEGFDPRHLAWAGELRREEYYIRMMQAWYFATALARQWEATLPWLQEGRLSPWVHQKTIQKGIESLRIPPDRKEYLKTLRTDRKKSL